MWVLILPPSEDENGVDLIPVPGSKVCFVCACCTCMCMCTEPKSEKYAGYEANSAERLTRQGREEERRSDSYIVAARDERFWLHVFAWFYVSMPSKLRSVIVQIRLFLSGR
jgi:hypothetical protein